MTKLSVLCSYKTITEQKKLEMGVIIYDIKVGLQWKLYYSFAIKVVKLRNVFF